MTNMLQSFCATDAEPRECLRSPWRVGEWIYATNGHWLMRIADDGRDVSAGTKQHPDISRPALSFDGVDSLVFEPIPALLPPKSCPECKRGKVRQEACTECDDGDFSRGSHTYQCKECDGNGYVTGQGDESPCGLCDGSGERMHDGTDVGVEHYATHYLRRLQKLPGIAFHARPVPLPGIFKFDGGYGLLMPLRRD